MTLYQDLQRGGWRVLEVEIDSQSFLVPRQNVGAIERDSVVVLINIRYEDHDEEARADVEELLKKWEDAGKRTIAVQLRDMGLWKIFSEISEQSHTFTVPMDKVRISTRINTAVEARGFVYDSYHFNQAPERQRPTLVNVEAAATMAHEDSLRAAASHAQILTEQLAALRSTSSMNTPTGRITLMADANPMIDWPPDFTDFQDPEDDELEEDNF